MLTRCDNCPLRGTDKPCPSADYPAYCKHMQNESRMPEKAQYWTRKLLAEADQPRKKTNPCDPDDELIVRPRPKNLDREVIVSKYKEDTSWVNDCPWKVTLYDKCPGSSSLTYGDHVVVRRLPNQGREAGTFLHHICENYKDLSLWSYFVQGSTHSGVELFGRIGTAYSDTTALTREYLPDFPSAAVKALDRVERHGEYEVRYGRADRHGDREPGENTEWLASVWDSWFTCPQPKDWYFMYAAEMAVPRQKIWARSLDFWRYARDEVNKTSSDHDKWDSHPRNAWAWELIFWYVLGDAKKYPVRHPGAMPKPKKKVTVKEMRKMGMSPKDITRAVQKSGGCGCNKGNK